MGVIYQYDQQYTSPTNVLDFYPIGSVYETTNSSFNPNNIWGGTWTSETTTNATVIESGDEDIWSYRKWSDGYAECWGKINIASRQYAANGGYYNVIQDFPTGLFYQAPYGLSVSGGITANAKTLIGFTAVNNKDTFQTYLINYNTSAVTNTAWVFVHAIGRWKATTTPTTLYKWYRTA